MFSGLPSAAGAHQSNFVSNILVNELLTDLVNPEPFICGSDETWEVPLDILNVIELGSQGIVDVDDNHFPICLSFIKQGHNTEDLDLFNLTGIAKLLANLANVERVIITMCLCLCMDLCGIFPSLYKNVCQWCYPGGVYGAIKVRPKKPKKARRDKISPEGRLRSSRYIHGAGNNCEQI